MKKIIPLFLLVSSSTLVHSQRIITDMKTNYPPRYEHAMVDFEGFKVLISELESHRNHRLINLETFLKMSKESNTIILDTRSDFRYKRKHLKGALHLAFTDFTQENLEALIPDPNTRILIYCNNNFKGDRVDFTTKVAIPKKRLETQITSNQKPIMLALNIPTYINLYGYGYRNIYELDELVDVGDSRIQFAGTASH